MTDEIAQLDAEYLSAMSQETAELSQPSADEVEETETADDGETAAVEEDETESPVSDADEASDTEEEAETESTEQSFSLDPIPSDEDLRKFPRTNPEAKNEMVRLAGIAREQRDLVDRLGGTEGVEIAEPIISLLRKAETTPEERGEVLTSMFTNNWSVALQLVHDGTAFILGAEEMSPYADRVLQDAFGVDKSTVTTAIAERQALEKEFGEKASLENLRNLLKLDAMGLIDNESFDVAFDGSELYEKQQQAIAAAQAETNKLRQEMDDLRSGRTPLTSNTAHTGASKQFDDALTEQFLAALPGIRNNGRWTENGALDNLNRQAVLAEIRNHPQYKEAIALVSRDGYKDTFPIKTALKELGRVAAAKYQTNLRGINDEQRTRVTKAEAPKQEAKPTPKVESKPKAPSTFNNRQSGDSLEELEQGFLRATRDLNRLHRESAV